MNLYREHLTPTCRDACAAQQASADAQATRWIERELVKLMHPTYGAPFDGHEPRITWARREGTAHLVDGGRVIRADLRRPGA